MVSFKNIVVAFGIVAQALRADTSKEAFYTQASRMVVRLEQVLPNGGLKLMGTGFFVNNEKSELFIVTARHVVDCKCDLRARVSSLLIATGKTEVIELRLPSSRWVFHALEGDANTFPTDVAVPRWPPKTGHRWPPENRPIEG